MSIRQLNHVVLRVTNLEKSLEFYRDVLGLTLVARLPKSAHSEEMLFLRSPHESTRRHVVWRSGVDGTESKSGGDAGATNANRCCRESPIETLSQESWISAA